MMTPRKTSLLLFFLTFLFIQNALAQRADNNLSKQHCGTYEYNNALQARNPLQKSHHDLFDAVDEATMPAHIYSGSDSIFTIPVVVHIVYHANTENLLDQQIESQIEVLNEDYSGTNLDIANVPYAFKNVKANDVGLRFCLATLDPDNQPINGITRTHTNNVQFDFADDVKSSAAGGVDAWPPSQYLNVWVCNLSGSLLGYAQYPGTGPDSTDGVVIKYKYFGRNGTAVKPYNKGRTLTHEVGHWLNLYHTWGDDGTDCTGSDKVGDTPNQAGNTFGCPSYPHFSCSNDSDGGDMFMNYMDYTDDACMCLFTAGQRKRMMHALDSLRPSIKLSKQTDCAPVDPRSDFTTTIIPNPNDGNFIIRFKKGIPQKFEINLYDILGHVLYSHIEPSIDTDIETGIENRNFRIQFNSLSPGIYFLRSDVEGHTYKNKIVINR